MRAFVVHRFGDTPVVEDFPEPDCPTDGVKLRVQAAAINFADVLLATGRYQLRPKRPFVPGFEAFGEVIEVGSDVTRFRPGDRVLAFDWWGAFAEVFTTSESKVFPAPANLTAAEAACLTTATGTAHHALLDRGSLAPDETVVVLGAAGGVGVASLQVAAMAGARPIGVVSSDEKEALARASGAVEIIRSDREDLRQAIKELTDGRGADVVVDLVGGTTAESALRSLAYRGRLLVVGFVSGEIPDLPANLPLLKSTSIVGVNWGVFMEQEPEAARSHMAEVVAGADAGHLVPPVTRTFTLDQIPEAFGLLTTRQSVGRLALTLP